MRRIALALLVSAAVVTARAAEAPDAGLEAYALTMPNVLKMAHAFETLDALAKKNPALRAKVAGDDEGSGDLAHLIAKCEADPLIKSTFAAAGISVREAVLTEAALAVAAAGDLVQKQTGKAPTGNPTTVANVKFYQEHLAEIEPINARLQKLSILHEGEVEDDEGQD
jgi:hypothetical protein